MYPWIHGKYIYIHSLYKHYIDMNGIAPLSKTVRPFWLMRRGFFLDPAQESRIARLDIDRDDAGAVIIVKF